MRRLAAFLLALAAGTPYAQQVAAPAADPAASIRAYDEFRPHALLSWHPLRREMLVRRHAEGIDRVHLVAEPGTLPPALTAIAEDATAAFQPTHGDYFVIPVDGRLQRFDIATRALTPLGPEDARAGAGAWNRKGDRFAYFAENAAGTELRIVDPLAPRSDRALARMADGAWSGLRFSEDGLRLVALQSGAANAGHLWTFDVASGRRHRVTRAAQGEPGAYGPASFSRDGRSLFTLSARGGERRRLVQLSLADGRERVLTAHNAHDVDDFAVSFDAERIAFVTDENGSHVLRFLDTRSLQEQPRPALFDGVIGGLAWRRGSPEMGFHITSARSAGDVFSYDVKANRFTRWTNGNNPAVNTRDLAEPRIVKWLTADGRQVTGLHYHPPSRFAGRRPVIVSLPASPGSPPRAGFIGRDNYLVSELGVAMIFPRFRDAASAAKDLEALRVWIGSQPDLDAGKVIVRDPAMPFEEALAAAQRALQ
jgi:dipeptidyl aminopeptidase/acylaminoacyl peptidase